MRWASPSTPSSLRMMSWIDLMVLLRFMGFAEPVERDEVF